jgi:hypothetical protein
MNAARDGLILRAAWRTLLAGCLLLALAGCGIVSIGITNSPPSPNSCAGDGRPSNGVCPH